MNYIPMFDRVVIKRDAPEETTKSGFILASASTEQVNTGKIVAAGPGKVNKDGVTIPMTVKVDDKVMFPFGAGITVKVSGQELLVLKEEELIAILDGSI
jgi:chaperonin GroES